MTKRKTRPTRTKRILWAHERVNVAAEQLDRDDVRLEGTLAEWRAALIEHAKAKRS